MLDRAEGAMSHDSRSLTCAGSPVARDYRYEGPLIRLIKDQGYDVRIEGSQHQTFGTVTHRQ